jgi:hypothetical protein
MAARRADVFVGVVRSTHMHVEQQVVVVEMPVTKISTPRRDAQTLRSSDRRGELLVGASLRDETFNVVGAAQSARCKRQWRAQVVGDDGVVVDVDKPGAVATVNLHAQHADARWHRQRKCGVAGKRPALHLAADPKPTAPTAPTQTRARRSTARCTACAAPP